MVLFVGNRHSDLKEADCISRSTRFFVNNMNLIILNPATENDVKIRIHMAGTTTDRITSK